MDHRNELLRLLSLLCDDALTEAERVRLEELLANAEARRLYLQYVDMHSRLLTHPGVGSRLSVAEQSVMQAADRPEQHEPSAPKHQFPITDRRLAETAASHAPARSRWRGWTLASLPSYGAVAAATLAISLLGQWLLHAPPPAGAPSPAAPSRALRSPIYVATLSQASHVEWGRGTEAYGQGARILAGDFELRQGVARLAYEGGVELIIEGPARLQLESDRSANVLAGKVVFRADDASAPFLLTTPASVLTDLGTEYAVEVSGDREEVHVFDGEVQRLAKDAPSAQPELLAAGEAQRYQGPSAVGERAIALPQHFVRRLPVPSDIADAATTLLAYEGFAYDDPAALRLGTTTGGHGFIGPWGGGFARAVNDKRDDQLALNTAESLTRAGNPEASVGGSFSHVGFAKYFRRLATPVRLDTDGVYYLSFLLRREGPPLDRLSAVSVQLRESQELALEQAGQPIDLRKRLNAGVDRTNELFTHLERIGRRMPLPLSFGETYLLVAKVAASGAYPDQVFLRVYGPQEPVDAVEPANWSAIGPLVESDLVLDWLEVHINSSTRQSIDEIRLGTTWNAAAGPWTGQGAQQ